MTGQGGRMGRVLCLLLLVSLLEATLPVKKLLREHPEQDIYPMLQADDLDEWATGLDLSLAHRAFHLLDPLDEVVQIHVVLAGFDDLSLSADALHSHLARLRHQIPVHVVREQTLTPNQGEDQFDFDSDFSQPRVAKLIDDREDFQEGGTGRILVDRVVHYQVVASTALGREFEKKLHGQMASTSQRHFDRQRNQLDLVLDGQEIDSLVDRDYQTRARSLGGSAVIIYLFHAPASRGHQYRYGRGEGDVCTSSFGIGEKRWMWLDVGAGPVRWGPRYGGEGLVDAHRVPYLPHYRDEGKNVDAFDQKQLLMDLAGWIRRSVELVICPAVDHLPFLLSPSRDAHPVHIHLVRIRDKPADNDSLGPSFTHRMKEILKSFDSFPFDVETGYSEVSLAANLNAASAFMQSVRDYIYAEGVEDEQTVYHNHQYLDSAALHHWLQKLQGSFYSVPERVQVIPVFLFDFEEREMMLLDRKWPVVSFPDMVIAVQTKETAIRVPFQCHDRPLTVNGHDVTRRLDGAIMQALHGILPTGEYWSDTHQRVEEDWLWNVARTPFGVFNQEDSWSFAQTDASHRTHLYQLLNQTLTHAIAPMIHLQAYGYELHHLLPEEDFVEFAVRWNLLRFKLRESVEQMSIFQWADAYRFVRSAYKDAERLLLLTIQARAQLSSLLQCENNISPPWYTRMSLLIPVVCTVLAIPMLIYLCWTGKQAVPVQRKKVD